MKVIRKFAVPIIFLSIFILFSIVTVIYTAVRNEIGINSNDKVIAEVRKTVSEDKKGFEIISNFLIHGNRYSNDFKIELFNSGVRYTSFDTGSFSNKGDGFKFSEELIGSFLGKHQLKFARVKVLCGQKTVTYGYEYRHFYPINREVYLCFFPEKICDSVHVSKNDNPEWYNWVYGIDEHWLIESKRED